MDIWEETWVIPSLWVELRELTMTESVDRAGLYALIPACPNLSKLSVAMDELDELDEMEDATRVSIEDRIHANLKALFLYAPADPNFSPLHAQVSSTPNTLCRPLRRAVLGSRGRGFVHNPSISLPHRPWLLIQLG